MGKINPYKRALGIMGNIRKHVYNGKWVCICNECSEKAINSHLLMRNGILNYVVEDGHLYELRSDAIEAFKPDKMPISLKKVGINQALSLPLFCNNHDTELFAEIEREEVNYANYRHLALYCYRALLAEIRKKEIELEILRRESKSAVLYTYYGYDGIRNIEIQYENMKKGIQELNYYCDCLKSDIDNDTESFVFFSRGLDIKGVYASSTSSLFTTEQDMESDKILNTFFFHLIPTESATQLIIGYHKEHYNDSLLNYVKRWQEVLNEEIGIMLTALFTQIETWGMSPSLYERIKEQNITRYYNKLAYSLKSVNQIPREDFNLFDGII